ncbi:aminoacyl-tRNA hydrolase [Candidatus Gracilibacteria bacterium]|jgi:PTH1 family peptidyl-tRNA hydrolase|nr:aminoacyl-tRNA hydrolase [Candidatus Gracilibacteria bacterium]
MKIIVGLGNIGEKYENTRHNVGFMFIDELIKELGKEVSMEESPKFKAEIGKISHEGEDFLLVKPTTFMNLSGEAVSKILNFYKENPKNLFVIYDDVDLPLGKIRVRDKGSAGTHNGMKSVIQQIGTENFTRIRIGIESRGVSSPKQQDISDFVLSKFKGEEISEVKKAMEEGIKELKNLIISK